MKSHITLKINGNDSTLKPDASIEINDQNPIFNDTEMYTLPFELPFDGNRQFLKNVDSRDSSVRPVEMDGAKAVLYIDGLPFRSGYIVTEDQAKLKNGLSVNIDAKRRSLEDLIGDLDCQDIPVKDRIVIGEKIGNVKVSITYDQNLYAHFKRGDKSSSSERTLRSTITGLTPATATTPLSSVGRALIISRVLPFIATWAGCTSGWAFSSLRRADSVSSVEGRWYRGSWI